MGWKTWMDIRSIAEKEGRVVGVLESSGTSDDGLVAMLIRALQAGQALIEECNYHKDELLNKLELTA